MRLVAMLALYLLAAISHAFASSPCHQYEFEGSRFTVCGFRPSSERFQLFWTDRNGKSLQNFDTLKRSLGAAAENVLFGMNAGMFEKDGTPLGVYIEHGSKRRPLNKRGGDGNFYMKPNGVFAIDAAGSMKIETTDQFESDETQVEWATQSGPMLVMNGALAPQISPDGPSKNIRNGVGLRNSRDAFFAISDDPVSFGKLARFFRDGMSCPNALYFDGAVSSLWVPSMHREDSGAALGPMLVVSSR